MGGLGASHTRRVGAGLFSVSGLSLSTSRGSGIWPFGGVYDLFGEGIRRRDFGMRRTVMAAVNLHSSLKDTVQGFEA